MAAFYSERPGETLRFGDVVVGFTNVTPRLKRMITPGANPSWSVDVTAPQYFAVLTPCCSIERKCINLAPLENVLPGMLRNPFFEEDLTRINRKVPPEKSVPPHRWGTLDEEEQADRLRAGYQYVLQQYFVYAAHDLLRVYQLPRKPADGGDLELGHYLIDFKRIFRVDCDFVDRGKAAPADLKVLELSLSARELLRDKVALFFARVPKEDQIAVPLAVGEQHNGERATTIDGASPTGLPRTMDLSLEQDDDNDAIVSFIHPPDNVLRGSKIRIALVDFRTGLKKVGVI